MYITKLVLAWITVIFISHPHPKALASFDNIEYFGYLGIIDVKVLESVYANVCTHFVQYYPSFPKVAICIYYMYMLGGVCKIVKWSSIRVHV